MRRVLLIGDRAVLEPVPDRFVVQHIDALDEGIAALAASEKDGVMVNLVGHENPADAIDRLVEAAGRSPVVVIVDGDAVVGAPAPHGVRLVSAGWLKGHANIAWEYLQREFAVAWHVAELMRLRDRQEQLLQNEKLAAVGLLAAEIAHEINNPATFVITNLTVMGDYVQAILDIRQQILSRLEQGLELDARLILEREQELDIAFLAEDLPVLIERSLAGLHRIHQIVQDLRYFGRDRVSESGHVDLEALVRASVGLVKHEAKYRARLEVDVPSLPVVRSDGNRLSQVILNLLVNAVQAIDAGDPANNLVRIGATTTDGHVVISVSDTGSGMSKETLARVFEPFFTTKEEGAGTGLGLAISHDIMRSLGGKIVAESELGQGSKFEVWIPL